MKLSDRIRRWWAPAKWRDEHLEVSDGEGFALSEEDQRRQTSEKPQLLKGRGMDDRGYWDRSRGPDWGG
jgi:hypothetical protein